MKSLFVVAFASILILGILDAVETQAGTGTSQEIPGWIKQNAEWWSTGQISDESFVNGV